MAKNQKAPRQNWEPHWLLRLLRGMFMLALALVKIAVGGIATVLLVAVVCAFVLVGAAGDYLQEDVVPYITFDLDNYNLDQTSFIYNVNSKGQIEQMQKIYTDTDRQWASFEEIPQALIDAAVSIEDKRFYEHQGVDWITTVKACAKMFFGDSSMGGSTITQQLIKNLTQEDSVTVQRKVQEIFKAQKFESQYDKDVVMEWYLNTIYLGQGKYGVKSAARVYFGKELSQLTTAECAALISITNNPSLFDPYIRPQNNRNRQLIVLGQMLDQGYIDQTEYDEAVAQEMVFTSEMVDYEEVFTCPYCKFTAPLSEYQHINGITYCDACVAIMDFEDENADMYSWFTELVMDDVAEALAEKMGMDWNSTTKDFCLNLIKKGGYHIYSTIDMDIQNIVDEVYTNLDNVPTTRSPQQLLSAGVVIDNTTGDIVAVAGSVGEKTSFDAFSFATDGGLQTGSVMKPLTVYAPAFEAGAVSPATIIADAPLTYDGGAFPLNESRSYSGHASVLVGVCNSLNTTAVHVLDKIGLQYSYDFAKNKFGLHNLLEYQLLENGRELTDIGYSPLALGGLTYGVTVREMANAYATFPNGGEFREARTFTKVYDSEGNLIIDNTQDSRQILSEKANNYMNYCLRSVVTNGTGSYAALNDTAVAAKTGTTSDNRDRWFIGYTGYYTMAVWCGYKQPEEIQLTGNYINPALRMWRQVMSKIHAGYEWKNVHTTYGMSGVTVCKDTGKAANQFCETDVRGDRVASALVYSGDGPSGTCDKHVSVEWCVDGDGYPNEFCKKVEGNKIAQHTLLKCTWSDLSNVYKYSKLTDNGIYLVDSSGKDAAFHGINNDINTGINAPYKVCTKHSEKDMPPPETEPPTTAPTETVPQPTVPAETTPAG